MSRGAALYASYTETMPSVMQVGPRLNRGTILNANSFATVANAEYPMAWPVLQFYEEVRSPESGLQPLLYADVTDVTCYHRRGSVSHDYLIMCIRVRNDLDRFGGRVWARCERNPGSIDGGPLRLSVQPAPAVDTIRFSFERSRLRGENDSPIMELAFDSLQVIHVADLLHVIHNVSPDYRLGSHNCWWFAAVAIGTLQVFGKDWTIQPSRDWIKSAVKALGRSTEESSQRVLQLFVQKWNIGHDVDIAPLTDDRAWSNHGPRRHQIQHLSPNTYAPRPSPHAEMQPYLNVPPTPTFHDVPQGSLYPPESFDAPPAVSQRYPEPAVPQGKARRPTDAGVSHSAVPSSSSPPHQDLSRSYTLRSLESSPNALIHAYHTTPSPPGHHSEADSSALGLHTGDTPPPLYSMMEDENEVDHYEGNEHPSELMTRTNSHRLRLDVTAAPYSYDPTSQGGTPYTSFPGISPQEEFSSQPRGYRSGSISRRPTIGSTSGESRSSAGRDAQESITPSGGSANLSYNGQFDTALSYSPSVYSTGNPEGEDLSSLVWRIVRNPEPLDKEILLATYPAFTTGADLLQELKTIYKRVPPGHDDALQVQPRILRILRQWTSGEFWDPTLGSELNRFLLKQETTDLGLRQNNDVAFMFQKLSEPLHPNDDETGGGGLLFDFGSRASPTKTRKGFFNRSTSSRSLSHTSLARMNKNDLIEIARVLDTMEEEYRARVTIPRITKWLIWKCGPGHQANRPFSPLSDKLATWSLDVCLEGNITQRANCMKALLTIAEHCRDSGNMASMEDILFGLKSSLTRDLIETKRVAGNVDDRIQNLSQSLNPRLPHRLYPLNGRVYGLLFSFRAAKSPTGLIQWRKCQSLYNDLRACVEHPTTHQSTVAPHPSSRAWVTDQVHQAWANRGNHAALSQKVTGTEKAESKQRNRAAAGFS